MRPTSLPSTTLPFALLLCVALTGCAGANATREVAAAPAEAPAPAAAPPTPTRPGHNAQAAAKKDDTQEQWWQEGGVTREKINAMCWMKYERGRADLPLDKRADLVNQCVADAEKQYRVQ